MDCRTGSSTSSPARRRRPTARRCWWRRSITTVISTGTTSTSRPAIDALGDAERAGPDATRGPTRRRSADAAHLSRHAEHALVGVRGRRTNFGDVKPDTTDLAKLLLIEFGLVYANDWFLDPAHSRPAVDRARSAAWR